MGLKVTIPIPAQYDGARIPPLENRSVHEEERKFYCPLLKMEPGKRT